MSARLFAVRVSLREANAFVRAHHRHHTPARGCVCCIGAAVGEELVGVVIVGRPVSRVRDDNRTAEITRLCTTGHPNAPSFLLGRAARAAFAIGFTRIGTYTLPAEGGGSLRAAGWKLISQTRGGEWTTPSRPRAPMTSPTGQKWLWQIETDDGGFLSRRPAASPGSTRGPQEGDDMFKKLLGDKMKKFNGKKDFLEGVCAACALMAFADGSASDEDVEGMLKALMSNAIISAGFNSREIETTAQAMLTRAQGGRMGRMGLMREIEEASSDPDQAEAMLLAALDVAESDGDFSEAEQAMAEKLAAALKLDLKRLMAV